ncbi:hypothetical protein [Erwinia persicina]|uniref:Lipoprotein n=1 Tax=Erwinia persicina TaxID=55211 RepID=A0A4U3FMY2_9GAMM|nr:hypothetical protein [Erwinia persicina]TKJ94575.1 hypothetical protein EpCFBP13511_03245 [Erwinia persicina]
MKKFLMMGLACAMLSGCGQESATDKVLDFIKTKDINLLSKTKIAECKKENMKDIGFVDGNYLPTTNAYYSLSDYLYSKVKYEPISEKRDGDVTVVEIKGSFPKPIEDAKSFIFAENPSAKDKSELDNLNGLYQSGKLDHFDYTESVRTWIVLPDGIDPQLTNRQLQLCSE